MSSHQWQFPARFRRNAFGWRSQVPQQRIKEALSEICQVAKRESAVAAEGAVLFLEKLSPTLSNVDSSSGAIGAAVNSAIEMFVPIISNAIVSDNIRQKWLERLWEALQQDEMPYIEYLGDFWGELCVTPALASTWADYFMETVLLMWSVDKNTYSYFKGTMACFSALLCAQRFQELLNLLEKDPLQWWPYRRWGVKALLGLGKPQAAIEYAENTTGLNTPRGEIARTCETILLSMGLADEAYQRYALEANQATTHLAKFRAIAKKYPHKEPMSILHDLIASEPGAEGKWFAAAKSAGYYEVAIKLVSNSPTDPRTLARAAKEFVTKQPSFAVAAGLASLHWIVEGYGYEISSLDVLSAYFPTVEAAQNAGMTLSEIKKQISKMLELQKPNTELVRGALMRYLTIVEQRSDIPCDLNEIKLN